MVFQSFHGGNVIRSGSHATAGSLETLRWGDYDAARLMICWQELAELPEEQKKTAATKAVGSPSFTVLFTYLFTYLFMCFHHWILRHGEHLRPLLHIVRCGVTCGRCRSACGCIAWRFGARFANRN